MKIYLFLKEEIVKNWILEYFQLFLQNIQNGFIYFLPGYYIIFIYLYLK